MRRRKLRLEIVSKLPEKVNYEGKKMYRTRVIKYIQEEKVQRVSGKKPFQGPKGTIRGGVEGNHHNNGKPSVFIFFLIIYFISSIDIFRQGILNVFK